MAETPRATHARLVFPAYLDVPMMISFLATLEGGVRFEDQITIYQKDSSGKDKEVSARVGLPSVLSLLSLSASGRLRGTSSEEASEEVSMVRRHTEASLFNVLLSKLDDSGSLRRIEVGSDLTQLSPGDFVEIAGQVVENPLKRLLTLLIRMAPLLGIDIKQLLEKGPPRGGAKGKQTPAVDIDALEGVRLTLMFGADMFDSPIEDLVLEADGRKRIVVTADREFLSEGAVERLLGCEYKVLGKVTRVLAEDSPAINLTRRCALGLLPDKQVAEYFKSTDTALKEDLQGDLGEALINGPALQVLPLAIYV
jgi:hypothetical protein